MNDERYHVPVQDDLKAILNELAHKIEDRTPPGWGFNLLLFKFNESGGPILYISNAMRADMVKAIKEFLANLEPDAKKDVN